MERACLLSQFIKIKLTELEWLSQITELVNGKIRFEVEERPKPQKDAQGTESVIIRHMGLPAYLHPRILRKPHEQKKHRKGMLMWHF